MEKKEEKRQEAIQPIPREERRKPDKEPERRRKEYEKIKAKEQAKIRGLVEREVEGEDLITFDMLDQTYQQIMEQFSRVVIEHRRDVSRIKEFCGMVFGNKDRALDIFEKMSENNDKILKIYDERIEALEEVGSTNSILILALADSLSIDLEAMDTSHLLEKVKNAGEEVRS